MTTPSISIIIPNLRSPILQQVLDALLAQELIEEAEILVIGQNDAVDEADYAGRVHFERTPQPVNAAVARNIGIGLAKGEKLLFIDSDCLAEPGWVKRLTAQLDDGWDVVGGGVRTEAKNYWVLVYNLSMFHEFLWTQPERQAAYLPTLNLGMKRSAVDRVGLLDESLARSQDLDWTMRMRTAGLRMLFDPRAAIIHLPVITGFGSVWRQYFRGGSYSARVRLKYSRGIRQMVMKQPLFWLLGSPLIALFTLVKILIKSPIIWRYAHTLPFIYLTKIAWCWGAAKGVRRERKAK